MASRFVRKLFPAAPLEAAPAGVEGGRTVYWAVLLLFAVSATAVLAYWPTVRLPFLTEAYVEQELARRPPTDFLLASAYGQQGYGTYYRFGTRVIDHLVWRIAGDSSTANHFVQVLLHSGCVALLFLLVFQSTGRRVAGATFAALFLALHPSISGAVALTAVRWNLGVSIFLLALANAYQFLFSRQRATTGQPPRVSFVLLAPVVLFMATVAELGALAMGVLGLWLVIRCLQRDNPSWTVWSLGPLALVPVIYLAIRRVAIGSFFSPYVEVDRPLVERLGVYLVNLLYDTALLLNPLRVPLLAQGTESRAWALLAGLAVAGVLVWLAGYRPVRGFLRAYPLGVLGLGVFFLFQLNALWLVPRPPIAVSGIDRGYVYYLAVVFLGLLLGQGVQSMRESCPRSTRPLLAVACVAWLAASAHACQQAVALFRQAGALLDRHEQVLAPRLADLEPGTAVFLRGFPSAIEAPYLPRALAYYYSHTAIVNAWAGEELVVFHEEAGAVPPGFDGWIIDGDANPPTWERRERGDPIRAYLEHQQARDGAIPSMAPLATGITPAMGLYGLEVLADIDGVAEFRARHADPHVALVVDIAPMDYGLLRYDLRVDPAPGVPGRVTTQVYYSSPGSGYSESRSISAEVPADGGWHTVEFPLFLSSEWLAAPRINRLRFDWIDAQASFAVRRVILDNDPGRAVTLLEPGAS